MNLRPSTTNVFPLAGAVGHAAPGSATSVSGHVNMKPVVKSLPGNGAGEPMGSRFLGAGKACCELTPRFGPRLHHGEHNRKEKRLVDEQREKQQIMGKSRVSLWIFSPGYTNEVMGRNQVPIAVHITKMNQNSLCWGIHLPIAGGY